MMLSQKQKQTVWSRLCDLARHKRDAVALTVPGRAAITFADLAVEGEYYGQMLDELDVRRNERVGILLPNCPATVTTFIGVASRATAAPLNPAYGRAEFEFYLTDLNVKALLIDSALDSAARHIAKDLGIPVVDVSPAENGRFAQVKCPERQIGKPQVEDAVGNEDIALVLHTSGTTSRPKMAPLSHANILSSTENIIRTLELTSADRCLTIMPLFHIHGIMVTLSALISGGEVCPVGFDPQRFFSIVDEFKPTWYSAVPTMHQAILRGTVPHRDTVERCRFRFIRSSSAALPVRVKAELESVFNAPVIESYGMTEAAHQMASNPLPPRERKPGSVGLAAGPEIAIMDDRGSFLAPGETGEVVIRGANVFQGYENNQQASAEAFRSGCFRTGDQGYIDADGYLFLTGRIKDIVNRGGEKISPAEVDEVLLNHPAIEQAITFPIPHPTLGEDIAAAVIAHQGAEVSEKEIRDYVAARVAAFKVPQRVLIVSEIPKGPTGKIQRRSVADKLGITDAGGTKFKVESSATIVAGTLEANLVQLWEELLQVRPIGIHDNFFELGGDSLLAVQMILRVEGLVGKRVPLGGLFAGPTVSQLSHAIESDRFGKASSLLIELNSSGTQPPLFFLHGDIMGGGFFSLNLAQILGANRPVYVLNPHGLNGESIPKSVEDMAAYYVEMIRKVKPKGPYLLAGYCKGGMVAFEMARQFEQQGEGVDLVLMVASSGWRKRYRALRFITKFVALLKGLNEDERLEIFNRGRYRFPFSEELQRYYRGRIVELRNMRFVDEVKWFIGKLSKQSQKDKPLSLDQKQINYENIIRQTQFQNLDLGHTKALEAHQPSFYSGKVVLLWPLEDRMRLAKEWKQVAPNIEIHRVPGSHTDCVTTHVASLGNKMKAWIDKFPPNAG
jgi:acyl-CoA synthetase (AMP-forming)/AMP-acid ligase II/thioesterase domain-containing protein/acyl carrier protein